MLLFTKLTGIYELTYWYLQMILVIMHDNSVYARYWYITHDTGIYMQYWYLCTILVFTHGAGTYVCVILVFTCTLNNGIDVDYSIHDD